MRRLSLAVAAVTTAAVGAVVLLTAQRCRDQSAAPPAPPIGALPTARSVGASSDREAKPLDRAPTAIAPAESPPEFVIEIVDGMGRPTGGQIATLESRRPPLFMPGANFDAAVFDHRIRVLDHEGRVEVARDPAAWLSVAARGPAGIARSVVPPQELPASLRIELSRSERSVLVMTVEPDLQTLVRSGELRVLRSTDDGGVRESTLAIAASGITHVDFEDARSVKILAPGAAAADHDPHAAVVHAPASPLPHRQLVTVVTLAPRVEVNLEIEIDGQADRHSVLALRRIDDGSFREVPWTEPLRSGQQVAQFRVEPGDYEVVTWPRGQLVLGSGDSLVRARLPAFSARLFLRAETARTRLELRGIERWKFPVHVQWQAADGILSARPGSDHLGPWKWRDPEQAIAVVDDRGWIVAQGPNGAWISTSVWEAGPVVEMAPATLLSVAWRPSSVGVVRAWLEVDSPLGDAIVPLRLDIATSVRGRHAGFLGSCYLPREPFEITCIAESDGAPREMWHRRIEPKSYRCPVEVAER